MPVPESPSPEFPSLISHVHTLQNGKSPRVKILGLMKNVRLYRRFPAPGASNTSPGSEIRVDHALASPLPQTRLRRKLLRLVVPDHLDLLAKVADTLGLLTQPLTHQAQLALLTMASRMETSKMSRKELHSTFSAATKFRIGEHRFNRWLDRYGIAYALDDAGS